MAILHDRLLLTDVYTHVARRHVMTSTVSAAMPPEFGLLTTSAAAAA